MSYPRAGPATSPLPLLSFLDLSSPTCLVAERAPLLSLFCLPFSLDFFHLVLCRMRAQVCTLEGHSNALRSVCVTPDGKHVVTGSDDNTARVWRLDDGKHVRTLKRGRSAGCLRAYAA
eukprot:1583338-Pleurochrysis_carterae.AAC.2